MAIFVVAALGSALSLALGAYLLGGAPEPPALSSASAPACAPGLVASAVPGTFVVAVGAAPASFDAVALRWTLADGAVTPWRAARAFLAGVDGVTLADGDASGTLSAGDAFTVSGGARGAELRCVA